MMNALSALNFGGFVTAAFTANPLRNAPITLASNLVSAGMCHMDPAESASSSGSFRSYRQPCASGSKPQEDYYGQNSHQESDDQRRAAKDLEANAQKNRGIAVEQGHRAELSAAEAKKPRNSPATRSYYVQQETRQSNLSDLHTKRSDQSSQAAQALRNQTERRENYNTWSASTFESPIGSKRSDSGGNYSDQSKGPSAMHPNR